jgi:hypothetical protein
MEQVIKVRHYVYRATSAQLNEAYRKIEVDERGTVVQTFQVVGRDFIIVFSKPGKFSLSHLGKVT